MRGMLYSVTYDGKNLIGTEQKIITLNKNYQPEGIFSPEEIKVTDKKKNKVVSTACPIPEKEDEEEYEDMSLLNIGQEVGLPNPRYIPEDLEELDEESSTKKGVCLI